MGINFFEKISTRAINFEKIRDSVHLFFFIHINIINALYD